MRILLIEDEETASRMLKNFLEKKGYEVLVEKEGRGGIEAFRRYPVDIVLLDWKLPDMNGDQVFDAIREIDPSVPVIFITAYGMVEKAVEVLRKGAFHYITKPLELDELFHVIKQAEEKINLRREVEVLKERLRERYSFENFIAHSEQMQQVLALAMRVAASDSTVLLTGESGTGKEMLANIIHQASKRSSGPFVPVNLAALPETLIEAELFGAEKGAYTGATTTRIGKFEAASGGTIFLDEVGEIPPAVQVKLLRVIQEKEIQRIGSNKVIKVDVRIIAATNKDLWQLVQEGRFREDLYYRLNVIQINLPPLRERKEDIPYLVDFFIKKYAEREGKQIKGITREALNALMKYNFPGNIRELENIIERAVVLARSDFITLDELPVHLTRQAYEEEIHAGLSLPERLRRIERQMILEALQRNNFNQLRTAKELGISESTLRYRMKILGLKDKK